MKLLEKLILTPGVPGREHRVRELIKHEIKGLFDDVRTDALGSLICTRKTRPKAGARRKSKPLRVMIAAHMDQIGFLVKHIDDKGYLRVNSVGGFDTRNLFARTVTICPDLRDPRKDIIGVFNPAGKPIHVSSAEERKKIPEVNEFVIDVGLPAKQVQRKIKIGDMVVLHGPMYTIGKTVVGQCMDNRVACWIAIRAMQKLVRLKHDCEIVVVFTVQEEVGLRGAQTSSFAVEPDIGIAVDTTLCLDTPGIPEDQRCTVQGEGVAIDVMDSGTICDLGLVEQMESIAKRKKIKHQRSVMAGGSTDAAQIQRAGPGRRTITLSCPTRYIHTVAEMVHLDDLHACRDLLAAYLTDAG